MGTTFDNSAEAREGVLKRNLKTAERAMQKLTVDLESAEDTIERLRVQLAGCSVAALGGTK
jgi:hypothetical protein